MAKSKAKTKGGASLSERRTKTIQGNKEKLRQLGIAPLAAAVKTTKKKSVKRKRAPTPTPPTRRSTRQRTEVSYTEPKEFSEREMKQINKSSSSALVGSSLPTPKFAYDPEAPVRKVKPSYDTSEGKRDKAGKLVFADEPTLRPNLTPKQMLAAGVFGGCYFNPKGGKPGVLHPKGIPGVTHTEFPKAWFKGLDKSFYASRRYKIPTNKYKVKAGQDQVAWERSGWINPQDPRGWFQWYCRFFLGRRTEDDERQIGRWDRCTGQKGRWKNILCNKIARSNKKFDDASVSPVIRQTLLHWGYELTEADFKEHLKRM